MENKKEELKTELHESGGGQRKGRSRRHETVAGEKKKTGIPVFGIAAAVIILTAGGATGYYISRAETYKEAFLPNTTVNGMDVSEKTVDEVKSMIEEGMSGYELTILERTGLGEVITKEEIGLHSEFDGSLEKIIEAQEPMKWILSYGTEASYEIETMIACDEAKLEARVNALACMDESMMEEPQDAYLSEYRSETRSYEIVPETQGTELIESQVLAAVTDAVLTLEEQVDLDALGCYTKPAIGSDHEPLRKLAAELNTYVGAVVNHTFGDETVVLDGDEIHTWLTIDGNTVTLDESRAAKYVRALAKKYNTAYGSRKMMTSYGTEVTVPAGPYGWRMNEPSEAAAVLEAVKAGNQVTRDPDWLQRAAVHGTYDYGDTYVEVNLTAQHLFFYKDGKLLVETDFVSGNASKGWATPAGAFPLTYKQRNATLRGENYETPVSYWMPFNGNIGLHDADWRAAFGGSIYKTNGSHGCINLPPKAAQTIYENIKAGDPVLCYHLDVSEKGSSSGGSATAAETTTAAPETTAAAPETTAAAPETTAAAPETTAAAPETTAAAPETTAAAPETTAAAPETTVAAPETTVASPETTEAVTVIPGGPGGLGADLSGGPGSTAPNTANQPIGPGYETTPAQPEQGPGAAQ